ncbi:MAG: metallophosphoesterase [Polyangiales bacterium]
MLAFLLLVLTLWTAAHAYVATRLVGTLGRGRWSRWLRGLAYATFVGLAIGGPLGPYAARFLRYPIDDAVRWPAWIYIGAFTVLFALMLVRDLVYGVARYVDKRREHAGKSAILPRDPERRRFLLKATGSAAVGVTAGLTVYGARTALQPPEVVEVEVPIVGLPKELDGYHIVQLSDVHVGQTIRKEMIIPIIEQATSLAPDLIALTGDLVDGSVRELAEEISPLGYLRAKDGVLCVTGNHEYYAGAEEWCAHFRKLGLTVLLNQHVVVQRGAARMLIAGITDLHADRILPSHASDPAGAIADAPPHDLRILLAHQPRSAHEAAKHGYKLQLSGHTHGGQFFPWNLFVGLVQPLSKGLGKIDDMWLYVNRGTCYWGPPNRAGVPAEITSLRLRRA